MPARAYSRIVSAWSLRAQGALLGLAAAAIAVLLLVLAALWAQHRLGRASVERYGSTITAQLAALAATPLVTHDRIDLNVITTHLADDPAIVNAAIFTLDNRLIGTGGRVPAEATADAPATDVFTHDITFEAQRVGYVRVVVDPKALTPNAATYLGLAGLVALFAGAWLGARLGAAQEARLAAAAARLATAPHLNGAVGGEAGTRAPFVLDTSATSTVALEALALHLAPDPEPEPPPPVLGGSGAAPYLLVLNLFNQGRLAPNDREASYVACQQRLQKVLTLYKGRMLRLPGTGLVALLDSIEGEDHAFSAICASLLTLRLASALNDERSRRGQLPIGLRGGLVRLPGVPTAVQDDALLEALGSNVSGTLLLSTTAKDQTLAIERGVFEDLLDNQRVLWTAVRAPFSTADDPGRFNYQITGLAPAHSTLLDGQAERLLARA